MRGLLRSLTRSGARTRPEHPDPRLRSRRYGIAFEVVWNAVVEQAGSTRGWSVVERDELDGLLRAEARTSLLRFVDDVEVRVSLDRDAQTRVDLSSSSRRGRGDLGTNARRIRRFLRRLDRGLGSELRPRAKAPPASGPPGSAPHPRSGPPPPQR